MNAMSPDMLRRRLQGYVVAADTTAQGLDKIAIAAAFGDITMFMDHVSDARDIFREHELFPSALNAAVAADDKNMVDSILEYMLPMAKHPGHANNGTQLDIRTAAVGMYEALLVAIRLHHHAVAATISEVLAKNKALGRSVPHIRRSDLFESCVLYSNVQFFRRALQYKRTRTWLTEAIDRDHGGLVETTEAEATFLFLRCSKWMLRRLLEMKRLDPNSVGDNAIPIFLAVIVQRPELTKVQLTAGAYLYSLPRGGG
jgi:hypothetical protein